MPYSQVSNVQEAARRIAERCPQMRIEESVLCRILVILSRDLIARLDQLLEPSGLAELEYRLLLMLFTHGGSASPGELCGLLTQSPANLTRIGDLLAARGLITRAPNPDDRRRQVISLTADGERLVKELMPRMTSALTKLFDGFEAEERERFLDYMLRLMRALEVVPAASGERVAP